MTSSNVFFEAVHDGILIKMGSIVRIPCGFISEDCMWKPHYVDHIIKEDIFIPKEQIMKVGANDN